MSDSALPIFRRIHNTPLRDLARGRITGRLNWKAHVVRAGLPAAAAELISRVVRRTRLNRLEKVAVADELIAHFQDGLASGGIAPDLVEKFGDERLAARLIRRAKKRGRSLPLKAWVIFVRAGGILLAIYAIFLLRFCLGQPTVSVDYVARLNEPILKISESDRAWPLWRQAILASSDGVKNDQLTFSEAIESSKIQGPPWPDTVKWLDAHASAMEMARQAGRKPALGFILGAGGSGHDPEMHFNQGSSRIANEPLITVLLPHLNDSRRIANFLSADVRLAAERGEGVRAEADVSALLGLARQLRESDGTVVTQLVGLGIDDVAVGRIRFVLLNHPSAVSDTQLVRLAHAISGPRVAADLISLKTERYFLPDILQRIYTDNGHGNGHVTLHGLRTSMVQGMLSREDQIELNEFAIASTVPMLGASRADLLSEFNRLTDQSEANLRLPIRQTDRKAVDSQLIALKASRVQRIRYALLVQLMPAWSYLQTNCEHYLGDRDGAIVGISLELYHRQHGAYPATLAELTPDLLPEIPTDRITGDPVKYRLIDGKPIVYSVGGDRVDDGGTRPMGTGKYSYYTGATWDNAKDLPRGDWVLFGPEPPDSDDN